MVKKMKYVCMCAEEAEEGAMESRARARKEGERERGKGEKGREREGRVSKETHRDKK